MISDFTFCILAYNHSSYILEHLESIKYQVVKYGSGIQCKLIVSDDSSKDNTVKIVNDWLEENSEVFDEVVTLFNPKNIGTCQSVKNIVANLTTKHCKITASDDVYTHQNIFNFVEHHSGYSLVSGLPVRLVDGKVQVSFFEVFNYIASDYIYRKEPLIERLSSLSIVNAPNLFYSMRYLKDDKIVDFLDDYDVVEDWPLQVSIAGQDPLSNLDSTYTPLVFYRRTIQSTYLIDNGRFSQDQLKMFDYLIDRYKRKGDGLKVLLLQNRKNLFSSKFKISKLIFNVSKYQYFCRVLLSLPMIVCQYRKVKVDLAEYQRFYDGIRNLVSGENIGG